MSDANKEIVRQLFAGVDKSDAAIIDQLVSPNYDDHHPPPFPNLPPGIAGSHTAFELALAAFSDFQHEIEDQVAEGDKVVTRIKASGTHTGDFLGIPATGKKVTMTGIAVHRIANGKIVEHWGEIDALGLFQQLGSFPPG